MLNATQEAELRRLEILLNTLRRGGLAVALCENLALRDELMAALRPRLQHPLHEFALSAENNDPVLLLQDNAQPGNVAVFYDLEKAGPEAIGRLEFRRELVWEIGANLLLWVTGEGQRILLRDAPNFYSRRVLLVHFTGASAEKVFFLCGQRARPLEPQIINGAVRRRVTDFELDRAVEQAIARFRGQVAAQLGDEFVATFRNVGDLFSAAFEIENSASTAYKSCLGLHYGVAPRQGETIVGPDIEKTRWLSHLGSAGQILLSSELQAIAQEQISNISFYAHGAIERGIFGKQEVYESVMPGRHPLPLLNEEVPNNLPPRPNLHERIEELNAIVAQLYAGRNVALVGKDGSGKSVLALEAAHGALQARRFAGGVAWIQARNLTSYEAFRAALLGAFDIEGGAGTSQELDDRLNAYLQRAPCLIVLDGVHEAHEPEQVRQWALALPWPTQILATSRHAPPTAEPFEIEIVEGSSTVPTVAEPAQSVDYYVEQVRRHADLNQKANRDWFDAEWPNIFAAAQRAASEHDNKGLFAFLHNIGDYFDLRGLRNEEEMLLKSALEAVRALGDRRSEGSLLNNLGTVYQAQGRWAEAEAVFHESLNIKREFNERVGEGQTLNNLGAVYQAQGRWTEAEAAYHESSQIRREVGDRAGEGQTLNNLGVVLESQRQWAQAELAFMAGLAIWREVGNRVGEGQTLNNLGTLYSLQSRWSEAESAFHESLKIKRELGGRVGEGATLNNLAFLWLMQNDLETALGYARQAVAVLETTQDAVELAKARGMLAQIEVALADEGSAEVPTN